MNCFGPCRRKGVLKRYTGYKKEKKENPAWKEIGTAADAVALRHSGTNATLVIITFRFILLARGPPTRRVLPTDFSDLLASGGRARPFVSRERAFSSWNSFLFRSYGIDRHASAL